MKEIPSHPVLDVHRAIAWDIDGTLIDGGSSGFLRAYILAHPGRSHHVVTHRRARYAADTEATLARHGLPREALAGIHYCPDAYRDAYEAGGPAESVALFHAWKGATAAALGCGLLVDDAPDMCEAGCRSAGVAFLNSWSPSLCGPDDDEAPAPRP